MTKILLVEDDKSLREIYGVRLMAEGYEISSAGDGEEALALAIKDRPVLIISDVMMPKISGFDMLDILRSTTETKDIKVIMMTALSSEDQRARGEALGADRYLVKSQVGIEDVIRTVHEVLGDGAPAPAGPSPFATPAPSAVATPPAAPATPVTPPALAAPAVASTTSTVPPRVEPAAPTSTPPPAPVINIPTPAPLASSSPSSPAAAPSPATPAPAADLPQPTAPFSSPRPASLADRIVHPLDGPSPIASNVGDLMAKELDAAGAPASNAPVPPPPTPPTAPTPVTPAPADTPASQPAPEQPVVPQPQ